MPMDGAGHDIFIEPPGHIPGAAVVRFAPSSSSQGRWAPKLMHVVWATGFCMALGLGGFGFEKIYNSSLVAHAPRVDQTAVALRQIQTEMAQLRSGMDAIRASTESTKPEETIRSLRRSVEALKQQVEQVRVSSAASAAQLSGKIEKAEHDPSARLAEIAARLDKIDRDGPAKGADEAQKMADLSGRIERVERRLSDSTPVGALPPPRPAAPSAAIQAPVAAPAPTTAQAQPAPAPRPPEAKQTPSAAPPMPVAKPQASLKNETSAVARTDPKPAANHVGAVDGWVLRDVYDGVALLQARGGDLREVVPGEYLPGAGEVRAIERKGAGWIVLTSRGMIDEGT